MGQGEEIIFPLKCLGCAGAHPASYSVGNGDSFPGGKVARHKVDHSPPYSAKVKKEWSHTSTPLMISWRGQGQLYLSDGTVLNAFFILSCYGSRIY